MRYNLEYLIKRFERKEKLKYLFFWGHHKNKSGQITASCLSQWWVSPFVVDNVVYPTAEHWMMAQKALLFDDMESHQRIIAACTPAEAKKLGRQVVNFKEEVWAKNRYDLVVAGNLEKFGQHPQLGRFLSDTGNKILVEASPYDRVWGIGMAADDAKAGNPKLWNGLNLLGFALMEVRDQI